MKLNELDNLFMDLLKIRDFANCDSCLNGLQVERTNQEVSRVAFAVDGCLESFKRAASLKADLVFVHHGLLWNKPVKRIVGNFYNRIKFLVQSDMGLYGVHLPLDAHPELGNNIGLARALNLENIEPFGVYAGIKIGFKGILPDELTINDISNLILGDGSKPLGLLPFGPQKIKSIGIVSGGDTRSLLQAIDEKLDLFITGDSSHEVYHDSLEAGINVIFGGHYATETWGIKLVAKRLSEITDINVSFVDTPTGL